MPEVNVGPWKSPGRRSLALTADRRWKRCHGRRQLFKPSPCWWLTACTHTHREKETLLFNLLPHLHSGRLLSSPLHSAPPLPSPPLWSFLLHIFPSLLNSSLTSLSLSLSLLSFLSPSVLSFLPLACPTAERLQSEPSHLYPSLPLCNHPRKALKRCRESRLWPQQVSARLHPRPGLRLFVFFMRLMKSWKAFPEMLHKAAAVE